MPSKPIVATRRGGLPPPFSTSHLEYLSEWCRLRTWRLKLSIVLAEWPHLQMLKSSGISSINTPIKMLQARHLTLTPLECDGEYIIAPMSRILLQDQHLIV